MERHITDERTGLKYELVGEYYFIAGDDEPTERPIGICGQRHLRHLKQHHKTVYTELMTSGKLNGYLADLNEQAEDMFLRLVKELAERRYHGNAQSEKSDALGATDERSTGNGNENSQ